MGAVTKALLDIAAPGSPVVPALDEGLGRVVARFQSQLTSDVPGLVRLIDHVERYRGKMLRPSLALLSGVACSGESDPLRAVTPELVTVGAVVEMIHIATLVHDDVLDEADSRRGGATVNRLHGNDVAVIFGDYLISQAFHLCSTLDSQSTALRVGEITSIVCEGEMLQLANRGNPAVGRKTYFDIIERKTAALIALSCELGARHAGAPEALCRRMYDFGSRLGCAFQVQDDLLDIVGAEAVVGKSLGKDLEKGKVTLPIVHHLEVAGPEARAEMIELVRSVEPLGGARGGIAERLASTGSIDHARGVARTLVAEAIAELGALPAGPARDHLTALARAVVERDH